MAHGRFGYHRRVEITAPKTVMVLVALALVGGGGAWGYASVKMHGRLADVRNESRQIGFARGGAVPSSRQVEAQVRTIAETHHVELAGLHVTAHDAEGLGPIEGRVPALGATLAGRIRVYEIRGTATTHALAWTVVEPLEVDLTLRTSVTVRGGESTVRPQIHAPGVSTDVHGGLSADEDMGGGGRGL